MGTKQWICLSVKPNKERRMIKLWGHFREIRGRWEEWHKVLSLKNKSLPFGSACFVPWELSLGFDTTSKVPTLESVIVFLAKWLENGLNGGKAWQWNFDGLFIQSQRPYITFVYVYLSRSVIKEYGRMEEKRENKLYVGNLDHRVTEWVFFCYRSFLQWIFCW